METTAINTLTFSEVLDLSQFGDRVKHYGSTVMVLAGTTGSGKQRNGLNEGWHRTEKYGEVFIAPSGRAWSIKKNGDRLENVIVEISAKDILGNDRAFKKKDALRKQAERARTRGTRTEQPQQPLHKVSTATGGVTDASTFKEPTKPENDTLVKPPFVNSKVNDKNPTLPQTFGESLYKSITS